MKNDQNVWIIQAVREWNSRSFKIYYMVGFERSTNAPTKPGFVALNKKGDDPNKVYYRPETIVCDRLPEGCMESTFKEIYGQ